MRFYGFRMFDVYIYAYCCCRVLRGRGQTAKGRWLLFYSVLLHALTVTFLPPSPVVAKRDLLPLLLFMLRNIYSSVSRKPLAKLQCIYTRLGIHKHHFVYVGPVSFDTQLAVHLAYHFLETGSTCL